MPPLASQPSWPDQLLQLVDDIVWTATIEGRTILYANPAIERVYGRAVADFYENPDLWLEVVHPDDWFLVEESFAALLEHGYAETTYRIVRPNGDFRWLLDRKHLLLDDSGQPYQMGGIATDITSIKLADERLREVLENSLDVSYKRNLQTNKYEYLSPVFEKLVGLTSEEMKALPLETVLSLMHPDDAALVGSVVAAAMSAPPQTPFKVEYRFKHKDGQYRWFHDQFIVVRNEQHQPAALIGSISDITERKQTAILVQAQRDLARIIGTVSRSQEAWPLCMDIILSISGLDSGGIYLFDVDQTALELVYHQGLSADFVRAVGRFTSDSRNAQLVKEGKPLYLAAADLNHVPGHVAEGLQVLAIIPILYQGRVLGSINLASHTVTLLPGFARRAMETIAAEIGNYVIYLQARASLQQSEERFRTLFETMVQGVVYQDETGRIISANSAAEHILGLSLDQLQGRTSIDPRWHAIHEDGTNFPGETHPAMVALNTGQPVNNVIMGVFHPKQEDYVWININAIPRFRPGQNRPYQVYATFEDITERKINEDIMAARLRLVEFSATHSIKELLQAALDEIGALVASPIGFYHFVEADQSTLSLQAWSSRTSAEFCTVQEEERHYPISEAGVWADCVRKRRPIIHNDYAALENRHEMPPGHVEVAREAITPILRGDRIVAIVGVGNKPTNYTHADLDVINILGDLTWDIIERKQAEESLRDSQLRVELALKGAQMGMWDWYVQTGHTVFNERWAEIIGYSLAELEPVSIQTWVDMCHPDDLQTSNVLLERHFAGKLEFYECEVRMKHKNGSWVWVVDRGQVVEWDTSGRPMRMSGTHLDITARKQAEQELLELNRDLEARVQQRTAELARASRAKDEFLANMSHELRTPLNAILNFSEILQEQVYGPLNEQQHTAVHHIETGGHHLLSLINDILDLSKVEAGQLDFQFGIAPVADICQASLLFVKEMATKKSLKLGFQLNDQMAEMETDPKRLKQMLVNLLTNAVKFTPDGGRVSLQVVANDQAGIIRFTVQDSGIGIAPEDMAKLFKPFVQLDAGLSRQFEGTGLGLALVRRLAELHGGSIAVESQVGQGSRFTLSLPYKPPAVPAQPETAPLHENGADVPRPAAAAAGAPSTAGARILLAEDSEANILMYDSYLTAAGYRVNVARNGHEALALADELPPDLILMDIQMPRMDGLEAMRHLRDMDGLRTTPIIALTALAMPGDRERCLQAGADEYLAKPANLRELMELIERLLTANSR